MRHQARVYYLKTIIRGGEGRIKCKIYTPVKSHFKLTNFLGLHMGAASLGEVAACIGNII